MDLYHNYGVDLKASATGDFALVDGPEKTNQHIVRRLLTMPGTYIRRPTYGVGLGQYVGVTLTPAKEQEIISVIKSQIALEDAVAKSPAPQITITKNSQGLLCQINYVEANLKQPVILSFQVTA